MSGFSLSTMFSRPAAQPAQPAAAAPTTQANPTSTPNPDPSAPSAQPQAMQTPPTKMVEGLDLFAEMFQNSGASSASKQAPSFTIPTEALEAAKGKMNFLDGAPEEAMQKLQNGDLSGLNDMLNHVGRQAYAAALSHGSQVTGKFLDDRMGFERDQFGGLIDERLATNNLDGIQDLHPVAQDLFRQTVVSLKKNFPQASSEQIQAQAWAMLESLGGQLDRKGRMQEQQKQAAEPDWDKYAGFAGDN